MRGFTVFLLGAIVASGLALGCQKKAEERPREAVETALPCDCEEPCPECEEGKGAGPGEEGKEPGPGDEA